MSGSAIIHKVPVCPATVLVYKCNDWSSKVTRCIISPYNWTITVISKHEINNLGMNCCGSNVKITGVKSVYGGHIHQVN